MTQDHPLKLSLQIKGTTYRRLRPRLRLRLRCLRRSGDCSRRCTLSLSCRRPLLLLRDRLRRLSFLLRSFSRLSLLRERERRRSLRSRSCCRWLLPPRRCS